jgi:glycosyltransferase involved in cell wall biosynthesis
VLVGRKLNDSLPLLPRPYRTHRMRLVFTKGPLFYAGYNIRLFLYMIFHKADILVSNDLDTLPATHLAAIFKKVPHVHDCHEYFRGMPELNERPFTLRIWKWFEDRIFPKLDAVYAVNGSIAKIYSEEYKVPVIPVRNVPLRKTGSSLPAPKIEGINENDRIILYQGAVNVDRGLEEAILAMKYLKSPAKLLIIGTGDVFNDLLSLRHREKLDECVILTGRIPFEELPAYTGMATIGLSIEKDVSLNYHYCLPNKFMDYIQAKVPVLISPLPEMKAVVEKYNIGEVISGHDPVILAGKIDEMLNDPEKLNRYRKNCEFAASELCWENEENELINLFKKYV